MAEDGQEKIITRECRGLRIITKSRYNARLGRWIVQEVEKILLSSPPKEKTNTKKTQKEGKTDPYSDQLRYDL